MLLVIGLGNPGPAYAQTRHNIGFLVLDHLAAGQGLTFRSSRWQALTAEGRIAGQPVLLVKPQTFMNNSGLAVAGITGYFRLQPADLVVIHDDLDLPLGRVKVVARGGAGGHNGIRSITAALGTDSYPRIKIGISRPPAELEGRDHVLGRLGPAELEVLASRFPLVLEGLELLISRGVAAAANRVNAEK
ncbi:MAG: aminoacyl-tRNA hydrolase [Thermodesulfobacteriota bacterium]